jgi:hypothetical protein
MPEFAISSQRMLENYASAVAAKDTASFMRLYESSAEWETTVRSWSIH